MFDKKKTITLRKDFWQGGKGTCNPEEMWEGDERLKQQVLPSYHLLARSHCFLTSHGLVTKSAAHKFFSIVGLQDKLSENSLTVGKLESMPGLGRNWGHLCYSLGQELETCVLNWQEVWPATSYFAVCAARRGFHTLLITLQRGRFMFQSILN